MQYRENICIWGYTILRKPTNESLGFVVRIHSHQELRFRFPEYKLRNPVQGNTTSSSSASSAAAAVPAVPQTPASIALPRDQVAPFWLRQELGLMMRRDPDVVDMEYNDDGTPAGTAFEVVES